MLSFLVLHSDEWKGLNAVFYKILNYIFDDLIDDLSGFSSLNFTSADLGRVKAKSPKYKSNRFPKSKITSEKIMLQTNKLAGK